MKRLIYIVILMLFVPLSSYAIDPSDVYHGSDNIFYVNPSIGEIKLRVKKGTIEDVYVVTNEQRIKMERGFQDANFDFFVARIDNFDTMTTYHFLLQDPTDSLFLSTNPFKANVPLLMIPNWAAAKVYYSIYTDGFYNGDRSNDPKEKASWGTAPKNWRSYGGDFKGIINKMAYIDSLNPDIILLQPIFSASSNHKLNTKDFAIVDSSFGDTVDLKNLINEVHKRNKKIILSVVFTHTGTDFSTFKDIENNGANSKYSDWYILKSTAIKKSPPNYECWRSDYRFPKLNLANPQVKNYLIGYLEYWKHFGFDGFFIGVDSKIDPVFIKTLRTHLKTRYPDLLLLGSDMRLLKGNGFDGASSTTLTDMIIKYFIRNSITTSVFDRGIQKMLFFNSPQINSTNLINVSSYSTRIKCFGKMDIISNIYAFLFTCVGSPVILYGDEIGMTDCCAFNLGSFKWSHESQNRNLFNRIKRLIEIRKANPQITGANFYTLYVNDITKVYAYDRGGLIVVLNSGDKQAFVELPAWDGLYLDLISGEKITAYSQKLKLSIQPISYRILKREI